MAEEIWYVDRHCNTIKRVNEKYRRDRLAQYPSLFVNSFFDSYRAAYEWKNNQLVDNIRRAEDEVRNARRAYRAFEKKFPHPFATQGLQPEAKAPQADSVSTEG